MIVDPVTELIYRPQGNILWLDFEYLGHFHHFQSSIWRTRQPALYVRYKQSQQSKRSDENAWI